MASEITIDRKLFEIYSEAYDLYKDLEKRDDPSNSPEYQGILKKCIGLFEDSTRLVSLAGMFSKNENFEEIPTDSLRYLLLPFFLGQLTTKICGVDRKNIVDIAKVYYEDFLKRCEEYELCPREGTSKTKATEIVARDEMQKLMQMAHQRNQKLQKYQQKKELDDQIKMLKVAMEREDVDEEIKRNFYLKLIKSCIWEAQDEIGSLEQEVEILQHISKMREDNPDSGKAKRPYKPVPLKPIIITKDALQKAVYGLGYPSLPTMTVKEFYDSRVAEGVFPSEEQLLQSSLQGRCEIDQEAEEEKANEQKELQVENDDPELLERARQMDDFKDDHRRGYGNRYNRS